MEFSSERLLSPVLLACLLVSLILLSGCNQHRYKPAKWRAASRQTTLPDSEPIPSVPRWERFSLPMGTMPMRMGSTLPYETGSTLPGRGGTMPFRGGSTLPMRSWSTLPGQGFRSDRFRPFPEPNWSTLPQRGGNRDGGTLPIRNVYPEYRVPQRNWSTLPGREELRIPGTLPELRGQSTMPFRANPLR